MKGLILSIFPGLDLFGRAFESEGWCVVRGPDLVLASDIRDWHAPMGRFDGVIGGPPCQCFSRLVNIVKARGQKPRHGNMIPEFERVVAEAKPIWWLMEEVPDAPIPSVAGYEAYSFLLSPRDLGDPQSRRRRFTFGATVEVNLHSKLSLVALEHLDLIPAVTHQEIRREKGLLYGLGSSWKHALKSANVQGFPELGEHLRRTPFTAKGACQLIANGVPRVMGEAIARSINEWWSETKTQREK